MITSRLKQGGALSKAASVKKTSFEVKHCKIETVIISRSAQAAELKKT